MATDYLAHIAELQTQLSNFSDEYDRYQRGSRDDEDRPSFCTRYLDILGEIVKVAEKAQTASVLNLADVVEQAEKALDNAVQYAFRNPRGPSSSLFLDETMDSFAHSDERPTLKVDLGEVRSWRMYQVLKRYAAIISRAYITDDDSPRANTDWQLTRVDSFTAANPCPEFKYPAPWKDVARPHQLSSRCARFMDPVPSPVFGPENLKARSIFQARVEVTSAGISSPPALFSSQSANCIFAPAQGGGWRGREPFLSVFLPGEESGKVLRGKSMKLGLADNACHAAADDDSSLLFVGDEDRIKSYSWWDAKENESRNRLLPVHTMRSKGFQSAIGILPNGRVARAGKGKVAVWNLNDLPTHQTAKGGIIGKCIRSFDTMRDDEDEIEPSTGSLPNTTFNLEDPDFTMALWHNHPSAPGTMLASSEVYSRSSHYYCRALNLDREGQCVTRYLGHGGEINEFSTSKGDANIFVTAARDGYARVYDVRTIAPVLTIQTGLRDNHIDCTSVVVCHPDGIPYIFSSEEEAACITLWDVRARAAVYDLSTGNNAVAGMIWNDTRNELWAATTCEHKDGAGYRMARIPNPDWRGEDDEEEEKFLDTDKRWPKQAYHHETYFGHTFDSAGDRMFRYKFKDDAYTSIVPKDGWVG